jgi:Bacterial Ig domain
MPPRLRGVLAALAVLLTFVLVPSASATCGLIDAYVPSGKLWYSAADAPPTVLWDMADDERTPRDFMNVTTTVWLVATQAGAFGYTATPAWDTYAPGVNTMQVWLRCASGTQTGSTVVRYDPISPTVSWSLPAAGQWLRGTVALRASGTDSLSGVTSFSYALPNGTVTSTDGSASFDTTGAADGTLVLSVVSVDYVGNRSATTTRVVKIDNSAPAVSVDAPASAFVASSSMTLGAAAGDPLSGVAQVRFEGRAGSAGAWQALGADSEPPYRLTLATPAVEGDYEVRAIATDAVGNEAASPGSARVIDRVAPAAALNAVPASVSGTIGLSAVVSDAGSGVSHVEFQAAPAGSDDWQSVGVDDAAPFATRIATTSLPDGAYSLRVLAQDAAGNETLSALRSTVVHNVAGAIPAVSAPATLVLTAPAPAAAAATPAAVAAGKRRVSVSARALPHRVEGGHAIVVNGIAKGLSQGLVVVTLQNARRPSLIQRVRTVTRKNGSFSVSFRPRFSGRVRVRFAGDETHRAAGADAGITRVHPRLIVSITATRAANGSLENPRVHGRLVPAGGPVRVVWQARPAHGGAWLLFCRTADQLAVGRNGVIDGTCHVTGLNADNRYRLVVLGDAGASYLPARTGAMVAQPTS